MRRLILFGGMFGGMIGSCVFAAEADVAPPPAIIVEAPPGTQIDENFVALYPNGFVARHNKMLLIGDALRHDLRSNQLYAEGNVVLVLPPLRVHAKRLGIDAQTQRGEAWDVEAWVDTPEGRMPIRAEHISFNRNEIVFTGLNSRRHGAVLGFAAGTLRIELRDHPELSRPEPARSVSSVSLNHLRLTALGLPWFYMPIMYRDFTFNYPWTQFRFGSSSRQGAFGIYRVATDLPEWQGLHTRVEGRVDSYSSSGQGYGGTLSWKHDDLGRGSAEWFGIYESIFAVDKNNTFLTDRSQQAFDAKHQAPFSGGAVSLRYTALPDQDPVNPNTGDQATPERFRNDYLRESLTTDTFAKQAAAVTWGNSYGTLVADTERQPNENFSGVDRIFGLYGEIPSVALIGPVHADGDAWLEYLDDNTNDHEAWRLTSQAGLQSLVWLGKSGFGVDGELGGRSVLYTDQAFNGVEADESVASVMPYGDAGLRMRLEADGGTWKHSLTPRIGVAITGDAHGDDLSADSFGQKRDELDANRQLIITSLDTAVWRGRELFRGYVATRFAMRPQDREGVDRNGNPVTANTDVVGARLTANGRPLLSWTLYADLDWDARSEEWDAFDVGTRWQVVPTFALRYDGSYNPVPNIDDPWEHRPGLEIEGNRYKLDGNVSIRPDGAPIDGWRIVLIRSGVDGRIGASYEQNRNDNGDIQNRRLGLVVSYP